MTEIIKGKGTSGEHKILGYDNVPGRVAKDASALYSKKWKSSFTKSRSIGLQNSFRLGQRKYLIFT